ncbi:MAG: metallophosphoesterase family protein [Aestuariivirga sp.]
MLIAFFADVHANHLALQACLARAASLGAEKLVFLGDLVGYGAEPVAVIETVRALAIKGAVVIKGNHDAAINDPSTSMNAVARASIDWTRAQLAPHHTAYLASLPLTCVEDDRLYVHADASAPARWIYVTGVKQASNSLMAAATPLSLCGHVHVPALYRAGADGRIVAHHPAEGIPVPLASRHRWLAVIGSVGQPRDGNPAAAFAIYDTLSCELRFERASYDVEEAARLIRCAGLPEQLAARLLKGR